MNKTLAGLAGLAGAGALTALSVWNYKRFMGHPLTLSEPGYAVETRPFSCPNGERTVCGELLLPKGKEGKLPTVILCHGLGSRYTLSKILAGVTLARSGYACCVFDFYGGNTRSISGGKMTEMSIFSEKSDLEAVTEAVKKLDTTDPEELFLFGESQGGLVSAITANEHENDYRAMVLYYPAFTLVTDANERFRAVSEIPDTVKWGRTTLGRAYYEPLLGWNVYDHLAGYRKNVLILHGDADKIINMSCAEKAAKIYEHAELHILPGQPHGFDGKGKMQAVRMTYEFLQKNRKDAQNA